MGGECSTPRSGRLTPQERDPVPVTREAGWATRPVWDSIPRSSSPYRVCVPTELSPLTNMEYHVECYEHWFWRNVTGSGCDVDSFVVPEFASVKCEVFEELFWGWRIKRRGFEPSRFWFKIKCCVTEPSLEIQAVQLMCNFLLWNLSSKNSDQEMQQLNVNIKCHRLMWCNLMFFWRCIMNLLYINYQLDALIIIYS